MNWYNNLFDFSESLTAQLKKLSSPITAAKDDAMSALKKAAVGWHNQYIALSKIPDSELNTELLKQKRKLVVRAKEIIRKTKKLGLGLDYAADKQMGFIPVAAVAVIAVVAGMMYHWTLDFDRFSTRIVEYKSFRENGLSHDQARTLINTLDNEHDSASKNIREISKYAAITGGAYLLYKLITTYES